MTDFADVAWLFNSNRESRGRIRMNLGEAALLWRYAKLARFGILEFGRYNGGSAVLLASAAAPGVPVTSVDLQPCRNQTCEAECKRLGVELLTFDSRTVTLKRFYDFVLIDGDHSFEGVAADWRNARRHMLPGAVVAFHDAFPGATGSQPDVVRFVQQLIFDNEIAVIDSADSLVIGRVL